MAFIKKEKKVILPEVSKVESPITGITEEIRQKFIYAEKELNSQYIEMTEPVRGLFLALLSGRKDENTGRLFGELVFWLSTTGCGKTYAGFKFSKLFDLKDGELFAYQFHPYSTPEEVFGHYDPATISTGLLRKIMRKLPTAKIAIFDEVFKAGPIKDALLMAINERLFQHGDTLMQIPLLSVIGSSNETPQNKHDAAFYDRFLLRYKVIPSKSKEFIKGLDMIAKKNRTTAWNPDKISIKEIERAKQEVFAVNISDDIYSKYADIIQTIEGNGDIKVELSPRRIQSIYNVLRASAWLSGRTEVMDVDFTSISPCLWLKEDDIPRVKKLIRKISNSKLDKLVQEYESGFDVYKRMKVQVEKYQKGERSLTGISEQYDRLTEVLEKVEEGMASANSINLVELQKLHSDLKAWQKEMIGHAMNDMEKGGN